MIEDAAWVFPQMAFEKEVQILSVLHQWPVQASVKSASKPSPGIAKAGLVARPAQAFPESRCGQRRPRQAIRCRPGGRGEIVNW
jgi:hypothetical protein